MRRNRRTFLKTCCSLGAAGHGLAAWPARNGIGVHAAGRRLQGAGLHLPVRRQRFEQHDRADRFALRRLPDDARAGRAGGRRRCCRPAAAATGSIRRSPTSSGCSTSSTPRWSSTSARWCARRRRRRSTARRCRGTSIRIRIRCSSGRRSDPNGGGTGWGGRINDLASALEYRRRCRPGITVNGGNSLFLSGPITKGLNFSNARFIRLQLVRRQHRHGRAPRLAAEAADVRQRLEAGQRRQRRARRFDQVGAGNRRRARRRAGVAGRVPELRARPAARAGRADHRGARRARHEPADLLRRHGRVRQSREPARQSRAADGDDRRRR